MGRRRVFATAAILAAIIFATCGQAETPPPLVVQRPAEWAVPLPADEDLPNLHRITDSLYRGAQPTDEGFVKLKEMGVKTVVNLRSLHSDRSPCEKAGLNYIHIRTQAWEGENEEVMEFLEAVTDPSLQPVFFHCQHGADRTGTMCALYRIVVQGWSREEAVREMVEGEFGFHSVWRNLIDYVETADVDSFRRELLGSRSTETEKETEP